MRKLSRLACYDETKTKNVYSRAGSLMLMSATNLVIFLFLSGTTVSAFDKSYSFHLESITESVKGMVEEGIPQHEIINTIKMELSLRRVKTLISKMYDGGQLSEEEVSELKSGEIDDDDEELAMILQKFGGMGMLEVNSTQKQNVYGKVTMANGNDSAAMIGGFSDKVEKSQGEENYQQSSDDNGPGQQQHQLPKPDYAFSPYDQFRLVMAEEMIYKPLKKYVKRMEAKLKILKSYTNDYEDTSLLVTRHLGPDSKFEDRATAVVSNPLTSYRMIRRFNFKLPDVWNALGEDLEEELWNDLSQIKMKYQPPNEQDWKDSMEALFRIQYYNRFDAKPFASGDLGSVKSKVKLTAEECMEIGLRALSLKKYDFALEWLNLSKEKHSSKADTTMIDAEFLDRSLQFAIKEHNQAWDATQQESFAKSHVFTKKLNDPEAVGTAQKRSSVIKETAKQYRKQEEYDFPVAVNFASLCGGENLQTEEEKSHLSCWLERSKHPYFFISPMKVELLSKDPYLIQVYEVIGDKLIERVKKQAVYKLERSQVVNYDDPQTDDVSLVRTSSQTWIPHWDLGAVGLENLTKLIEKITGLTTRKFGSSEDFQVACYGTSHHYEEHLDAVQDVRRTADFGERVATFMLYLTTVEEGGKTAFPVLGTAASPVKGSAVFWYNLKKNGEPDKRTWHGGCPVVHGIKWVMNNWILLYENMHNRPCGLGPHE